MNKEISLDDKSEEFILGFHAGVQYMKDEEDKHQVSLYLMGQLTEEDLSPKQLRWAKECMELRDPK